MSLVVIICVFNLVSFQAPLLRYALLVSNLTEFDGVIQIISLQVLQFCLLAMLLLILSSISVFVMKSVTAVLLICNALGLYFMVTYGIEIDRSMIANILNTDSRETAEEMEVLISLSCIGFGYLL